MEFFGQSVVHDTTMSESRQDSQTQVSAKPTWKLLGSEEKKAAVNEEINRMNHLPSNSTYATHRLKVLNKIMHLLSIQRTISQDEELELLFAGLHI